MSRDVEKSALGHLSDQPPILHVNIVSSLDRSVAPVGSIDVKLSAFDVMNGTDTVIERNAFNVGPHDAVVVLEPVELETDSYFEPSVTLEGCNVRKIRSDLGGLKRPIWGRSIGQHTKMIGEAKQVDARLVCESINFSERRPSIAPIRMIVKSGEHDLSGLSE